MAILCALLGAQQLEHRLERLLSISLEFSFGKLALRSFMGSEICEQTRVSFRMFALEMLEKSRSVASHNPKPAEHDAPRKGRDQVLRGPDTRCLLKPLEVGHGFMLFLAASTGT